MPNLTAWPTAAELTTVLSARGLTLPPGALASAYVDQAVRAWEGQTGAPYLGSGVSASALYDAPCARVLNLGGWWNSITAVAVGVTEAAPDGTVLDIGTNVYLEKKGGRVYALRFESELIGGLESVKVTGKSGWASAESADAAYLPDDAWQAVLNYAAALAMDEARTMQGVAQEVKSADVTVKFSESVVAINFADDALKKLRRAATPYKIFVFGR